MFRWLAIGLLICASAAGCKLSADYSGTRYRCDESGQCPDGYTCNAGYCEIDPTTQTDSGVPDVPPGCGTMAKPFVDFESTRDTRRWGTSHEDTWNVDHAGGQLVFTIPAGTNEGAAKYYSKEYYRMQGSQASLEVPPLEADSGVAFSFSLITHADEKWAITQRDGALEMELRDLYNEYTLATVPYVPDEHRYWRIREDGDTVYWETSPDAVSWTDHATASVDAAKVLVRLRVVAYVEALQSDTRVLVADNINGGVDPQISWCPISALADDFDDGQVSLVWDPWDSGTCAVFEQDGQLAFRYLIAGAGDCGYFSLTGYDLSQGSLVIEAPREDPGELYMYMNLDFHNGDDAWFEIGGGMLNAEKEIPGATGSVFSLPFDPDQHRWLRLRGEGGTLYWETSADGKSWDQQAVHSQPPFDLANLSVEIGSHSDVGAIDSIGNGFDNLNYSP